MCECFRQRQTEEKRKWPTLIYPGCSLFWLVLSEHLVASHSLPLSPRDHHSPTSFLQGHKYFPRTPYCFYIILQTPPNDSERQPMHPFSHDCHVVRTVLQWLEDKHLHMQEPHLEWYIMATCRKYSPWLMPVMTVVSLSVWFYSP